MRSPPRPESQRETPPQHRPTCKPMMCLLCQAWKMADATAVRAILSPSLAWIGIRQLPSEQHSRICFGRGDEGKSRKTPTSSPLNRNSRSNPGWPASLWRRETGRSGTRPKTAGQPLRFSRGNEIMDQGCQPPRLLAQTAVNKSPALVLGLGSWCRSGDGGPSYPPQRQGFQQLLWWSRKLEAPAPAALRTRLGPGGGGYHGSSVPRFDAGQGSRSPAGLLG